MRLTGQPRLLLAAVKWELTMVGNRPETAPVGRVFFFLMVA